jgi:hypothetical protein
LELKGHNDKSKFDTELENLENILPKSSQQIEVIASLVKIFNIAFRRALIYEEEKAFFENFDKEHIGLLLNTNLNNLTTSGKKNPRYSSNLGITYLLRFFSRLVDIVQKIPTESTASLNYLTDDASDFCTFLVGAHEKYYTDSYYTS